MDSDDDDEEVRFLRKENKKLSEELEVVKMEVMMFRTERDINQ